MKNILIALAMICAAAPAVASEQAAPAAVPATQAAFTVAETDIGTLLDNPASKAILLKHMPEMASNPQIDMARAMTLKQVQGFAPDQITDELLAKVDADLAALSATK
jgi:hypothetical protein